MSSGRARKRPGDGQYVRKLVLSGGKLVGRVVSNTTTPDNDEFEDVFESPSVTRANSNLPPHLADFAAASAEFTEDLYSDLFDDPISPSKPVVSEMVVVPSLTFAQSREACDNILRWMQSRPTNARKVPKKLSKRPSRAEVALQTFESRCEREKAPLAIEYILHGDVASSCNAFLKDDKNLILSAAQRTKINAKGAIKGPPRSSVTGEDDVDPDALHLLNIFAAPSIFEIVMHPDLPLTSGAVFGIPVGVLGQHYTAIVQMVPGPDVRMSISIVSTVSGDPLRLSSPFPKHMVSCLHRTTTGRRHKVARFRKPHAGHRIPGFVSNACPGIFIRPGYDDVLVAVSRALVTHQQDKIREQVCTWLRAWSKAHHLQPPRTEGDLVDACTCMVIVELLCNPLYTCGQTGDPSERAAALCSSMRFEMVKTALTAGSMSADHMALSKITKTPSISLQVAMEAVGKCYTTEEAVKVLSTLTESTEVDLTTLDTGLV